MNLPSNPLYRVHSLANGENSIAFTNNSEVNVLNKWGSLNLINYKPVAQLFLFLKQNFQKDQVNFF